jgi:hypothetical protein
MRSAAAALMVFAGNALAHPGHGAPEGHLHGWGVEHALLLVVIAGLLVYAVRK